MAGELIATYGAYKVAEGIFDDVKGIVKYYQRKQAEWFFCSIMSKLDADPMHAHKKFKEKIKKPRNKKLLFEFVEKVRQTTSEKGKSNTTFFVNV